MKPSRYNDVTHDFLLQNASLIRQAMIADELYEINCRELEGEVFGWYSPPISNWKFVCLKLRQCGLYNKRSNDIIKTHVLDAISYFGCQITLKGEPKVFLFIWEDFTGVAYGLTRQEAEINLRKDYPLLKHPKTDFNLVEAVLDSRVSRGIIAYKNAVK